MIRSLNSSSLFLVLNMKFNIKLDLDFGFIKTNGVKKFHKYINMFGFEIGFNVPGKWGLLFYTSLFKVGV